MHEHADGTRTTERRTTTYRAYTRAPSASWQPPSASPDARWHMAVDTDFFQPVMTARSPT